MLKIDDDKYFEKVKEFAEKNGLLKQLEERLKYLDTYAEHNERGKTKCLLFKDFAPYSFQFVIQKKDKNDNYKYWFNGGLIFHGFHDNSGDGSFPTLTVNLSSQKNGWSIHT